MHHSCVVPCEAPEPTEVEIEGVVEAGRGVTREAVHFDRQSAPLEFGHQREKELVPTAVGRPVELVKDSDISGIAS
jgi:hypothetical protein